MAICFSILSASLSKAILDLFILAGYALPFQAGFLYALVATGVGAFVFLLLQRGGALSKAFASLAGIFVPIHPVFHIPDKIRDLLRDWMIAEEFPLGENYRFFFQVDLSRRPVRLQISLSWKGKPFRALSTPKIPDDLLDRIEVGLIGHRSLLSLYTWHKIPYCLEFPTAISAHDRLRARQNLSALGIPLSLDRETSS